MAPARSHHTAAGALARPPAGRASCVEHVLSRVPGRLLAGWEALSRFGVVHEIILPAPTRIAAGVWTVVTLRRFRRELGTTLLEVLLGFLLAAAGGIGIGILTGTFELFRRAIYPYVVAFQVIPKVVFAPIFLAWFGYGIESKVVLAAVIAFFPCLINTAVGLRSTSEDEVMLMRSYVASRLQIFWKLTLPKAAALHLRRAQDRVHLRAHRRHRGGVRGDLPRPRPDAGDLHLRAPDAPGVRGHRDHLGPGDRALRRSGLPRSPDRLLADGRKGSERRRRSCGTRGCSASRCWPLRHGARVGLAPRSPTAAGAPQGEVHALVEEGHAPLPGHPRRAPRLLQGGGVRHRGAAGLGQRRHDPPGHRQAGGHRAGLARRHPDGHAGGRQAQGRLHDLLQGRLPDGHAGQQQGPEGRGPHGAGRSASASSPGARSPSRAACWRGPGSPRART